jgi:hypothetical protein
MTNEISGASLASNQITLPSGTYFIDASAPGLATESQSIKLRNTTDSSDTLIGTSEYGNSDYIQQMHSYIIGRFTIASQKTFEIQHRFGYKLLEMDLENLVIILKYVEVYTDVTIWKVA